MPMTPEVSYLKDISIELRRISVALNKINNTLQERRVNERKEITDEEAKSFAKKAVTSVIQSDIIVHDSRDNSMYYI